MPALNSHKAYRKVHLIALAHFRLLSPRINQCRAFGSFSTVVLYAHWRLARRDAVALVRRKLRMKVKESKAIIHWWHGNLQ